MAYTSVNIHECGYELYKYHLSQKGTDIDDYLYAVVITLPVPRQDFELTGGTGPYGFIRFSDFGLVNTLPYWIYQPDNGVPLDFSSDYDDGLFKLTFSVLGMKNSVGYASITINGRTYTMNFDTSGEVNPEIDMFCPIFFKYSDGTYYSKFFNYNYKAEAKTNNIVVLTLPEGNYKKGTCEGGNLFFRGRSYKLESTIDRTVETDIIDFIGNGKRADPDDPNEGGGNSTGGGGGGTDNIGGDTNEDDGVPTVQATDSGLLTLYNPTVAELQSLGKFLWSDSWSLDNFKKLFNDPFDTLLGLSVIPIKPIVSGSRNIMFGNLDSGVTSQVVSSQWVSKPMGSITLNEVWKGALDYAPSTGVSVYLPFIGMRQLNTNDVMGSTLKLIYKFDVLTGTCIAQLYVNHNAQGNKNDGFSWSKNQGLLYEFQGQCSVNIPLSSQDYTNTIRAAIGAVGMIAGVGASVATGNPALGVASLGVGLANTGIQAGTPTVERSGHMSGSASLLGYTKPFLIVERPHQCKPQRYYSLRGIPSQVYVSKLSECTGFTQITDNNNIHASGAQDVELEEIERLLSSGVYFPNKKRS